MSNTPKIRFEGFTDDWEQRKVSRMITDIADGPFGSNLKTEHYTEEKEARIIQLSNLSDYGWQEENTRYTTFEHAKEIKRCIVNEGELVMGKMMPAGMTIMRPNTEKMYILSSDCVRIKLDNNIATDKFFLYTTKSDTFLNQVNNDSQGSTRVRTSISKIRNMDISIPCVPEQEKIGEYFTNLDNLITLHQRKCDETKELKKYMLQKMFPKNGEKKPEIRFSGFTDDWEQRKLEKHIIEYHEVTTENNQYPVLTSSRKGIFLQTDYYSGNQVASEDNTGYNIVPYGYFTYRHMSDDEIFHFNINDIVENGIVSTLYPVFTTDEKLDSRYLQYQLNYGSEFAKFAVLQKQGGSRTYMYLNKLKKLLLTMPTSIDEQKKISSFLMRLDNLITLHQRKCDEIKEFKKYMLQNMFPQK